MNRAPGSVWMLRLPTDAADDYRAAYALFGPVRAVTTRKWLRARANDIEAGDES